jgi:glycerate kinase
MLIFQKDPIFVVADGVTLEHNPDGSYPNPSGAGELAKIFCHAVIAIAEEKYEHFQEKDIKEIFSVGNRAAQVFNTTQGRVN